MCGGMAEEEAELLERLAECVSGGHCEDRVCSTRTDTPPSSIRCTDGIIELNCGRIDGVGGIKRDGRSQLQGHVRGVLLRNLCLPHVI